MGGTRAHRGTRAHTHKHKDTHTQGGVRILEYREGEVGVGLARASTSVATDREAVITTGVSWVSVALGVEKFSVWEAEVAISWCACALSSSLVSSLSSFFPGCVLVLSVSVCLDKERESARACVCMCMCAYACGCMCVVTCGYESLVGICGAGGREVLVRGGRGTLSRYACAFHSVFSSFRGCMLALSVSVCLGRKCVFGYVCVCVCVSVSVCVCVSACAPHSK